MPRFVRRRLIESLEDRILLTTITGKLTETPSLAVGPAVGWQVYVDLDASGTLTEGDPSSTTDSAGNYSINTDTDLAGKDLRVVVQSGYRVVALPTGDRYTIPTGYGDPLTYNFNVTTYTQINGLMYVDLNGNGERDTGDVTYSYPYTNGGFYRVYADLNDNGVRNVGEPSFLTTGLGFFLQFPSGTPTRIRLDPPSGWLASIPTADGLLYTGQVNDNVTLRFAMIPPAPVAVISSLPSVAEGESIPVSAQSSTDPFATITSYEWDFNYDGTFEVDATGVNASFPTTGLDGPGSVTIALRVKSSTGRVSNIVTKSIPIINVPPTLEISGPSVATVNQPYTLQLWKEDPGVDTVSTWHIDWGDGTSSDVAGNTTSVDHIFTSVNSRAVISAYGIDDDGTWAAAPLNVSVGLDSTFGVNGYLNTLIPSGPTFSNAILQASNGKWLSLATPNDTSSLLYVQRNNADGSIDSSFGNNGLTTLTLDSNAQVYLNDAITLSDGRILILLGQQTPQFGNYLVRLNSNGTPDSSFGVKGVLRNNFPPGSPRFSRMTQLSDGSIIVSGVEGKPALLAKINVNGVYDSNFGANGLATIAFNFGTGDGKLIPLAGGSFLLAIGRSLNAPTTYSEYASALSILRMTSSGQIDSTFGVGGRVELSSNGYGASLLDAMVAPNGKILITASSRINSSKPGVLTARFNSDGSPDLTFSDDGQDFATFYVSSQYYDVGTRINLTSDGRIVLNGIHVQTSNGPSRHNFVLRYLPDGARDLSSGPEGIQYYTLNNAAPSQIGFNQTGTLTSDGKLLALSNLDGQLKLLRVNIGSGITVDVQAPAGSSNVTLNPAADAFVRDGTYATQNYGGGTLLEIKKDGTSFNREGYLKFDIASLTNVSAATLRVFAKLSATMAGGINLALYPVSDSSWTEGGITFANRPAIGAQLLQFNVGTTAGAYYDLDVTAYAQQQKSLGKTSLSFALKALNSGVAMPTINSKENANNKPQLVVTQPGNPTPPGVTPSIEISQTNVSLNEGASGSFTARLTSQPSAEIVLTIARQGDSDLNTNPTTLTFTPANWHLKQTVTYSAAEDADSANGVASFTISGGGLTPVVVLCNEIDNDPPAQSHVGGLVLDAGAPLPGWIPSVTVYLDLNDDSLLDIDEPSAVTGPQGTYDIYSTESIAGKRLRVIPPAGYRAPLTMTLDRILPEDTTNLGSVSFLLTTFPQVNGKVFVDWNNDGLFNLGDAALDIQQVYIDQNNNSQLDSGETWVFTNESGNYLIDAPAGSIIRIKPTNNSYLQSFPANNGGFAVIGDYSTVLSNQNFIFLPPAPSVSIAPGLRTLPEGWGINLSVIRNSPSEPTPTVQWDFDYDGVTFDVNVTGDSPVFSSVGLDGPSTRTIAMRAVGVTGRISAIDTEIITITNKPPTVTISGNYAAQRTTPYTLQLSSTDPGPDTLSVWTINWGDGVIETISGAATSATHTYSTSNASVVISASATDEDGTWNASSLTVQLQDPTPPPTSTVTLGPIADSFVRDGTYSAVNYGSTANIDVKKDGTSYTREGYFTFDLSTLSSITTAKLRIFGKLSAAMTGGITIGLFAVADTSWQEGTITFGNKPPQGAQLGQATLSSTTGLYLEWDVATYLQQQKNLGASKVSFAIKALNSGSAMPTFNSRNAASNQPQLVATQSTPLQAIVVGRSTLGIREGNTENTTIKLATAPTSDVIVTISHSGDPDLFSNTSTITFTPSNWYLEQTVYFSANEDADTVNGSATFTFSSTGIASQSLIATESDNDTPPAPTIVTLTAAQDAFVRDGSNQNNNYGSLSTLEVKKDGVGNAREAYLTFNLAGLTSVSNAKLRLFGKLSDAVTGGINVSAYGMASGTWSESTLTYSNRPATNATAIATANVPNKTSQWVEWDLTAYLQSQLLAGATSASIALRALAGGALITFNSLQSGSNTPQLVVTT